MNMAYASHETLVKILVATDSRGRLVKPHLQDRLPKCYDLYFQYKSGYQIIDLAKFITQFFTPNEVDLILLAVGVCDLTVALPTPHITRQSVTGMVDMLAEKYQEAYRILHKHSPGTHVIISPLIGVDFARYYRVPYDEDTQSVINESIIQINQIIGKWNQERDVLWPWMATMIHDFRKTHWVHRYDLLHQDGCHLTAFHAEEIAKQMAKCLKKNIHHLLPNHNPSIVS